MLTEEQTYGTITPLHIVYRLVGLLRVHTLQ